MLERNVHFHLLPFFLSFLIVNVSSGKFCDTQLLYFLNA